MLGVWHTWVPAHTWWNSSINELVSKIFKPTICNHVSESDSSVWDTLKEEENWLKKMKAVQNSNSKHVCLHLLWLDVKSVEGRKEEKGKTIKGKAIQPFVAEERRVKMIRYLKVIILGVCLDTNKKLKLFYYLIYFCYYLWTLLYFLVLFMGHCTISINFYLYLRYFQ